MNKAGNHDHSSIIDFRPSVEIYGREIQVDEENQTIAFLSRFENILVQQKELTLDIPYNKQKIQVLKTVAEFIAKTPNITQSLIDFVLQLNKTTSIKLTLEDWDNLDIVFLGASLSDYNGELDHLKSDFFNYQTICQEFSDFINYELEKVKHEISKNEFLNKPNLDC
jgi:hypothetical protein